MGGGPGLRNQRGSNIAISEISGLWLSQQPSEKSKGRGGGVLEMVYGTEKVVLMGDLRGFLRAPSLVAIAPFRGTGYHCAGRRMTRIETIEGTNGK